MKFLVEYGFVLLILYSCQHKEMEKLSFVDDSFNSGFKLSKGKVVDINDTAFALPISIKYHPKDYLICSEIKSNDLLTIVNLKTGAIQKVVKKGRGPNECIHVGSVSIVNDDIWVYGPALQKMLHLKLDSVGAFYIKEEFRINEQMPRCIALTNELFAGTSFSKYRVSYYNRKGDFLYGTLGLPKEIAPNVDIIPNVVFQTAITATPDGKHVVLANQFIDVLESYSDIGDTTFVLIGPDGFRTNVKPRKIGGGRTFPMDPLCLAYAEVTAVENEIWGSYIGVQKQKGSSSQGGMDVPKQIFCFSCQGQLLRKIEFDNGFISFAVDSKKAKVFCLVHEPDIKIVQYDITKLLN
ncbi:MAG: hypothetical protein JEZ14_14175 [Marinilabiliaceae bacterium]|nr:hypothetical protein [Marinilabiliaceae bacterium]